MKQNKVKNFQTINRNKAILALVSSIVVAVCVCVGVVMNLTTLHDQNFDNMGIRTFKMFTVNSNILVAISCFIAIPMIVDGLRKNNYHLPNWVVDLYFMGTTAVFLTFLVSLCLLAPVKGFVLIFSGSRFFLHGLCPILAMLSFMIFITDHRIRILETLYALIPVFIYALVYFVLVFVIGEKNGGWEDIYSFNKFVPYQIPMVLIMPLTFGLATVLRVLHNLSYDNRKEQEAKYFKVAYKDDEPEEIVKRMAILQKKTSKLADIVVPKRVITMIANEQKGKTTVEKLCKVYLDEYLKK